MAAKLGGVGALGSGFDALQWPGAPVRNILLQSVCPLDQGEHLSVVYDQIALREMLNALDPAPAVAPACVPIAPVIGG